MKAVVYMGSSGKDLAAFPSQALIEAEIDLARLQRGAMPRDFEYMHTVGQGAYEIRIKEALQNLPA